MLTLFNTAVCRWSMNISFIMDMKTVLLTSSEKKKKWRVISQISIVDVHSKHIYRLIIYQMSTYNWRVWSPLSLLCIATIAFREVIYQVTIIVLSFNKNRSRFRTKRSTFSNQSLDKLCVFVEMNELFNGDIDEIVVGIND